MTSSAAPSSSSAARRWVWVCAGLLALGALGGGAVAVKRGALQKPVAVYSLVDVVAAEGPAAKAVLHAGWSDQAAARAWLHAQKTAFESAPVELRGPDGQVVLRTRLGALGAHLDEEATLSAIERSAQRRRTQPEWLARKLESPLKRSQVELKVQFDAQRFAQVAAQLKGKVKTEPREASIDLDAQKIVAETMGHALDQTALSHALQQLAPSALLPSHDLQLTVPTVQTPPATRHPELAGLDISVVVGEFETRFSRGGESALRGQNVDRAAEQMNGVVIAPRQIISFNEIVGERSLANGFKKAPEIFKGEMVEGIGGGTCQVSSTVHAAAFFGGLDVVTRYPHSRPSAYISMGLDATVVYPNVDLKVKNPYDFPVVVHATTKGGVLKVRLLGRTKVVDVKYTREVVKRIPFERKYIENAALPGNRVVHRQHGIDGYRLKRLREMSFADGTSKVEETSDYYPPTADLFEVPPGFDAARLPASGAEPSASTQVAMAEGAAAQGVAARSADGAPTAGQDELVIVDAKGAHKPSRAQARPEAKLRLGGR